MGLLPLCAVKYGPNLWCGAGRPVDRPARGRSAWADPGGALSELCRGVPSSDRAPTDLSMCVPTGPDDPGQPLYPSRRPRIFWSFALRSQRAIRLGASSRFFEIRADAPTGSPRAFRRLCWSLDLARSLAERKRGGGCWLLLFARPRWWARRERHRRWSPLRQKGGQRRVPLPPRPTARQLAARSFRLRRIGHRRVKVRWVTPLGDETASMS